MPKYKVNYSRSPLISLMNAGKLQKRDIYTLLGIRACTFNAWLVDPSNMTYKHILLLSGMFGIVPEKLVYLLRRNKPNMKKDDIEWFNKNIPISE